MTRAALEAAREMLEEYGDHKVTCRANGPNRMPRDPTCDCGFSSALAQLDAVPAQPAAPAGEETPDA